jgi:hypothetical protein
MRERYSFQEALARIQYRMGIANVTELLQDAIQAGVIRVASPEPDPPAPEPREIFRDAVSLYAGGMTYIDREYDPAFQEPDPEWVSAPDLERWLDELTGLQKNPVERPHRPKGTNLANADAAFIERMREMIVAQSLPSPTAAAKSVVGDGSAVMGGGTPESKVRRLVDRYKLAYGE